MSVRVDERNLSKIEYLYNAKQICNLVEERMTKYINKIANDKRYKHFVKSSQYSIWNSPIYHATMCYNYCRLANKTRDSIKRLEFLKNAGDNLDLLETTTQKFYDKYRSIVKDKYIMLLTDKIDYQKRLLDGCKKYTKNVG